MLNVPPGAIEPEFHVPPFATDVCVVESWLVHVTVPPTETEIGLGAYAVVVIVDAPETMETAVPDPEGVGEVIDGDDEQPKDNPSNKVASAMRSRIRSLSFTHASSARASPGVVRPVSVLFPVNWHKRWPRTSYEISNDVSVYRARKCF